MSRCSFLSAISRIFHCWASAQWFCLGRAVFGAIDWAKLRFQSFRHRWQETNPALFLLFSRRQWFADLKSTYRFEIQVELLFDYFSWCNPSKGFKRGCRKNQLAYFSWTSVDFRHRLQAPREDMRKPILALFNSFKEDVLMFSEWKHISQFHSMNQLRHCTSSSHIIWNFPVERLIGI